LITPGKRAAAPADLSWAKEQGLTLRQVVETVTEYHPSPFTGAPDTVAGAIADATDLITQFNPAVPDHDAAIRALELIATEVAPALGWKPSPVV